MNVLIIYANPNRKSFGGAILDTMEQALQEAGHDVRVKDLYQHDYKVILDPDDMAKIYGEKVMPDDIQREQQDVNWPACAVTQRHIPTSRKVCWRCASCTIPTATRPQLYWKKSNEKSRGHDNSAILANHLTMDYHAGTQSRLGDCGALER